MKRVLIALSLFLFLGLGGALAVTQVVPETSVADSVSWNSADEKDITKVVESHKGKVILLKYWASWCGPCRESMPYTIALSKQYPELVVITVSFDGKNPTAGYNYLRALGATKSTNLLFTGTKAPYGYPGYIPYEVVFDKTGAISSKSVEDLLKDR